MFDGPPPTLKTSPETASIRSSAALVGVDQVADPERVADLLAVAEDRERLAAVVAQAEPGDPALVLDAELPRPVDARLAEDDRLQAVDPGVVADVLVARPLGAAVGGVEVERLGLVDAVGQVLVGVAAVALDDADVLEVAVDLVRRAVDHGRLRRRRGGRPRGR